MAFVDTGSSDTGSSDTGSSDTGSSDTGFVDWVVAWQEAVYGERGFYRDAAGPAAHFRTSAHASDLLAVALARLAAQCGLHRVVDVGCGRGELLESLRRNTSEAGRTLELVGCDIVPRPDVLSPDIAWAQGAGGARVPAQLAAWLEGALVVAHEWLDDVPCPVVQRDRTLAWRQVEVDPRTGAERLGAPATAGQREWLDRWWRTGEPDDVGDRAEVGDTRDEAWGRLVAGSRGCVLVAVDYGHQLGARPTSGSLVGYRRGQAVAPVPDGSCDVTAHVALDAVAAAGVAAGARASLLTTQRSALRSLGVDGRLPDAATAARDPVGYLREVSTASHAAELLDPTGLGAFGWLVQSTGPALPQGLQAEQAPLRTRST